LTECRTYLASMTIGWIMALLFLFTTIYTIYLCVQREKIRNQFAQNENEKDRTGSPSPS
ncbi:9865_t:CDS:1, partial [Funneliformis mosseae]